MGLYLNRILIIVLIFFFNTSSANNFNVEYKISTAGIKIGYLNWNLIIKNNVYQTEIGLRNTGFLTPLYKFEGRYFSPLFVSMICSVIFLRDFVAHDFFHDRCQ